MQYYKACNARVNFSIALLTRIVFEPQNIRQAKHELRKYHSKRRKLGEAEMSDRPKNHL